MIEFHLAPIFPWVVNLDDVREPPAIEPDRPVSTAASTGPA